MWRMFWHDHFPGDKSCPPHGLLLGDWGDGTDAWADEPDEGDIRVGWVDDVSNSGVGCCGICAVKVGEVLIVPITVLAPAGGNDRYIERRLTRYSIPHSPA